jgi:hypothetical protein
MAHRRRSKTAYRIRVEGNLDAQWSDWFDGFTITPQADGETLLTGEVSDQADLHGILAKIRDLNLSLLLVQRTNPDPSIRSDEHPAPRHGDLSQDEEQG